MKNLWDKIKNFFIKAKKVIIVIGIILIIVALVFPYVVFFQYLKKGNKKIVIFPKFKLKKIENPGRDNIDSNALDSAIRIADEMFKRIKK